MHTVREKGKNTRNTIQDNAIKMALQILWSATLFSPGVSKCASTCDVVTNNHLLVYLEVWYSKLVSGDCCDNSEGDFW